MTDIEKQEIIKRFLLELPATSDGRISKIVGCDLRLVSQVRRELQDSGELPRREIDDGKADDI